MGISQRPLSPHLGIYRWQLTMALSILHRASGVFLSLGAVVMVAILASVAMGPGQYESIQAWLVHPVGLLILLAWTFAFYLHLANGVRHLVWDTGIGLEKTIANKSGLWVVAFAILATLATWVFAWS